MASFVPYYRKKLLILKGNEDELRRLLAKGADESKLLKAVAVVRDSRIRVMRAKEAQLSPKDTPERTKRIENIHAEIEAILAMTPEAILAEFIQSNPKSTG